MAADGTAGGRVVAWGGQQDPHYLETLVPDDVVAVAAGDHELALLRNGSVFDVRGDLHVSGPTDVVAISSGSLRAAALTASGRVWVWGNGWYPTPVADFSLVPAAADADLDGDGLSLSDELRYGTDPPIRTRTSTGYRTAWRSRRV